MSLLLSMDAMYWIGNTDPMRELVIIVGKGKQSHNHVRQLLGGFPYVALNKITRRLPG